MSQHAVYSIESDTVSMNYMHAYATCAVTNTGTSNCSSAINNTNKIACIITQMNQSILHAKNMHTSKCVWPNLPISLKCERVYS